METKGKGATGKEKGQPSKGAGKKVIKKINVTLQGFIFMILLKRGQMQNGKFQGWASTNPKRGV